MGMPDTFKVDRLTNDKASHIAIRDSYHVTGYVLTNVVDGEARKCIVDCSAVRWMGGTEFFSMMHPISPSNETLVNRYLPVDGKMQVTVTVNDSFVQSHEYDKLAQENARLQIRQALLAKIEPKEVIITDSDSDEARGWNQCLRAVKSALEFV